MTHTHTASVATAVYFLSHWTLFSVLFFSKTRLHGVSDAVEQVCSVYSQSDSTYTQSMASRQARLCIKNNSNSNSRNEQISFSFIFICLSIEQSHTTTTTTTKASLLPSPPPTQNFSMLERATYECMRFAFYTHKYTNRTDDDNEANPIDNFLYAYLMLVAYRFMFCLH